MTETHGASTTDAEALDGARPADDKSPRAAQIVRTHMIAAVAAGVIPIPIVGAAVLGGVHLRMLGQLARLYDVAFSEQRAQSIIGSLVGIASTASAASLLRVVPGVGQVLGVLGGLVLPSASTYALGEVFTRHFASGGTFLTFDPERAKPDYHRMLAEKAEQSYAGIKP